MIRLSIFEKDKINKHINFIKPYNNFFIDKENIIDYKKYPYEYFKFLNTDEIYKIFNKNCLEFCILTIMSKYVFGEIDSEKILDYTKTFVNSKNGFISFMNLGLKNKYSDKNGKEILKLISEYGFILYDLNTQLFKELSIPFSENWYNFENAFTKNDCNFTDHLNTIKYPNSHIMYLVNTSMLSGKFKSDENHAVLLAGEDLKTNDLLLFDNVGYFTMSRNELYTCMNIPDTDVYGISRIVFYG